MLNFLLLSHNKKKSEFKQSNFAVKAKNRK